MATAILGEKLEYFHLIGMLTILCGVNIPLVGRFFKKKSYPPIP